VARRIRKMTDCPETAGVKVRSVSSLAAMMPCFFT
jgi:hypothetical protein